ncbi:uncharacterized protein LOC110471907 [Lonchura striata]|uniref:homeobox protein Hox-A3-like n=1 Tax=Lonchura striata TaxID=40157 RepID=UPI000B4CDFE4|nr:homeobox protein Hox-A3-like [Lonchura striata domestica]
MHKDVLPTTRLNKKCASLTDSRGSLRAAAAAAPGRCSAGRDRRSPPCGRDAPASASAALRAAGAAPGCVTDRCSSRSPALPGALSGGCARPHAPAPASPAEPSQAQPPAMCSALFSPSWKGSTALSAPPDFALAVPSSGPAPPVPACLGAIPLKGCCSRCAEPMLCLP